jgi:hypothetical protein
MPTRTRWPGDDGYDRMTFARRHGWEAIPSWGLNGWDLGSWKRTWNCGRPATSSDPLPAAPR